MYCYHYLDQLQYKTKVINVLHYRKVIKPRQQRNVRTVYRPSNDVKDDASTYEDITDGQRMSVINKNETGNPGVDYYNIKETSPRSENTYDVVSPYCNTDRHDYGKIKVSHT